MVPKNVSVLIFVVPRVIVKRDAGEAGLGDGLQVVRLRYPILIFISPHKQVRENAISRGDKTIAISTILRQIVDSEGEKAVPVRRRGLRGEIAE